MKVSKHRCRNARVPLYWCHHGGRYAR